MNMRTPQPLLEEREGEISTNEEVDFSEYMWMGEELEEFDRQVEEELWEEAFIEACFEEMIAEENRTSHITNGNANNNHSETAAPPSYVYHNNMANLEDTMKMFSMRDGPIKEEVVKNSSLNPEAPEFVPGNYLKR